MQKLAFHLADTSFTLLHRTGLAGLYMALSQLTKEQVTPPEGLTSNHLELARTRSDST